MNLSDHINCIQSQFVIRVNSGLNMGQRGAKQLKYYRNVSLMRVLAKSLFLVTISKDTCKYMNFKTS